jgi:hypothetical protein
MSLENDAKEFKRKREAEKKARQRAGYYVLPVQVHRVSVAHWSRGTWRKRILMTLTPYPRPSRRTSERTNIMVAS